MKNWETSSNEKAGLFKATEIIFFIAKRSFSLPAHLNMSWTNNRCNGKKFGLFETCFVNIFCCFTTPKFQESSQSVMLTYLAHPYCPSQCLSLYLFCVQLSIQMSISPFLSLSRLFLQTNYRQVRHCVGRKCFWLSTFPVFRSPKQFRKKQGFQTPKNFAKLTKNFPKTQIRNPCPKVIKVQNHN